MSSSPVSIRPARQLPPLFHILSTKTLEGSEVLVTFADGTSAVYESDELEKLRPSPKRVFPAGQPVNKLPFADVA